MEEKYNYYSLEEIKDIILSEEKLVYVDDGMDEVVVKYCDLADYLIENGRQKLGYPREIKVYKYPTSDPFEPIVTTSGEFLFRCDPDVRNDIINRYQKLLQYEEDIKDYKIIDEYALEEVQDRIKEKLKIKIIDLYKTEFGYIKCNAIITISNQKSLNIVEYFDEDDFENWRNSRKEIKDEMASSWEEYFHLPKISETSKMMQELYDAVKKEKAREIIIAFDTWNKEYTFDDLDKLVEEIEKYNLKRFITLKENTSDLNKGISCPEDYRPEIRVDTRLLSKFNNDKDIVKSKEVER